MKFRRKNRVQTQNLKFQTVPANEKNTLSSMLAVEKYQTRAERELYASLREAVPIIDAAICKIIRLMGDFKIIADNPSEQGIVDDFTKNVLTNCGARGINHFVYAYIDSLLTYGAAVGEMIPLADGSRIAALYNAGLDDVELRVGKTPLELEVLRHESGGLSAVKHPSLIIAGVLNPKPGTARGTSILSGLPFVSGILLRIFESVKNNWERVGDVRFAVTYKPDDSGEMMSEESARMIASEWKKAMRSESVCDFVSLGDVSVKVIGAESQMPDCQVPLRAVTEQIIAKLGIPPFLLGLSWSNTERMSKQQADILTSELEFYRMAAENAIKKAVSCHMRLTGCIGGFEIEWEDINLQDAVELSQARLNNAQAMSIEKELEVIENGVN